MSALFPGRGCGAACRSGRRALTGAAAGSRVRRARGREGAPRGHRRRCGAGSLVCAIVHHWFILITIVRKVLPIK